jgi:hypothetical protein
MKHCFVFLFYTEHTKYIFHHQILWATMECSDVHLHFFFQNVEHFNVDLKDNFPNRCIIFREISAFYWSNQIITKYLPDAIRCNKTTTNRSKSFRPMSKNMSRYISLTRDMEERVRNKLRSLFLDVLNDHSQERATNWQQSIMQSWF